MDNKTRKNYFSFTIALFMIIIIIAIQYLKPNDVTQTIITIILGIETLVVVGISNDIIEKLNRNLNGRSFNFIFAIFALVVLGSSYLFY